MGGNQAERPGNCCCPCLQGCFGVVATIIFLVACYFLTFLNSYLATVTQPLPAECHSFICTNDNYQRPDSSLVQNMNRECIVGALFQQAVIEESGYAEMFLDPIITGASADCTEACAEYLPIPQTFPCYVISSQNGDTANTTSAFLLQRGVPGFWWTYTVWLPLVLAVVCCACMCSGCKKMNRIPKQEPASHEPFTFQNKLNGLGSRFAKGAETLRGALQQAQQQMQTVNQPPMHPSQSFGAPPPQPQYGAPPPQPQYGASPPQPQYGASPPQPQYGAPPPQSSVYSYNADASFL